jgi:beta-galactosidase/beta-glucuronidase
MIRTFEQHKIRKQKELSGSLWNFHKGTREATGHTVKAQVPGCWEMIPGLESYRGVGTYETEFEAEGTVRIEFKGVSHTADIYVDGRKEAHHYNAYTAFSCIVKGLSEGKHTLTVEADNRFSPESALHVPNDYMSYGGITRPVVLENLNGAFIEWIHAVPVKQNGEWKVRLETCVKNPEDKAVSVNLVISAAGAEFHSAGILLSPDEEKTVQGELKTPGVREWDMHSPVLYEISGVLLSGGKPADDLNDRIGFREIKTEGKNILLNGRKIRIKGFCRHEDHPLFGCALPYAAIENDLMTVKDLGANSIRTSHYPNDEIFLDLCDEQGILVWEENHARGLSEEQMRNPHFEEQAETCIREMIPLHFNHPCIYIWGILNECASETEYGRTCYQKQYDLIRKLDSSRPRSSASCKFKTELCFDLPEVVSYNIYPEWYHDAPAAEYLQDLYRWVQEKGGGEGKPFLITEIGAGAIYGFRTPTRDKWSEEYQADALKDQMNAVLNQEGCSGMYIWQFCDVRISREWFSNRPRTMNNKGIVDEYRRRKLCYETVREIYRSYPDYFD